MDKKLSKKVCLKMQILDKNDKTKVLETEKQVYTLNQFKRATLPGCYGKARYTLEKKGAVEIIAQDSVIHYTLEVV